MRDNKQSVCRPARIAMTISELIYIPSALESELLEHVERSFRIKTVHIQLPCVMYYLVSVISLIDAYDYAERIVRSLQDRIDDTAVVLFPVMAGDNIEAVTDLK